MNSLPENPADISRAQVLEQLRTILASEAFRASERSSSLLRYVVEHTVDGQADCLKEYVLGTEVLGKNASFDPRTDTIVRAEASRLRSRLEKYYAAEGQADTLVIALPKGSYVPRFDNRPVPIEPKSRAPARGFAWLTGATAAVACVLALIAWTTLRPAPPSTVISIAVLPFANLSGDSNQEFFSDGMAEEINTALARIPNLRVVARSSAFQFKNRNLSAQAIGDALHATHIVEGSVRKDGTRLRITAQLVDARDGVDLWSASYDREFRDVFAVQEEIAEAVAAALRVPLGLEPSQTLIASRTGDLESYQDYLRARALRRNGAITDTIAVLENVVARDPQFAPAWSLLAEAYRLVPIYYHADELGSYRAKGPIEDVVEGLKPYLAKSEHAARQAIRLDPRDALAHSQLAQLPQTAPTWDLAFDFYRRALALDPNEPDILHFYSIWLAAAGYTKEALSVREKLQLLEPFVPVYNAFTASALLNNGQTQAAVLLLKNMPPESAGGFWRNGFLARAYAMEGRYDDAADLLLAVTGEQASREFLEDSARVLRSAPAKAMAPESLPVILNFIYLHVGAPERVLDFSERFSAVRRTGFDMSLWAPEFAPVRKTERFKALLRKAGLVDYWRAHRWPDLCRPAGVNDFACD